jgi:hypothetical protein
MPRASGESRNATGRADADVVFAGVCGGGLDGVDVSSTPRGGEKRCPRLKPLGIGPIMTVSQRSKGRCDERRISQ